MSGHSATGTKKLDKNTIRTSQKIHRNFLDENSYLSTEFNWQHQFSKTPPCPDFYPFPQEINLLFPVLWSFSPPSFPSFPSAVILFIYLSAVIILNFAVELKAVSTSVGLVVDAPSSNQVVPLNLSPDSFI